MNRLILISAITITCLLSYTQLTLAVCIENPPNVWVCNTDPPNPDLLGVMGFSNTDPQQVTVLPGAAIDTITPGNTEIAIETGNLDDTITIDEGNVSSDVECIQANFGNDLIDIMHSILLSTGDDVIEASEGNDIINIHYSTLTALDNDAAIAAGDDDDIATIVDSILTGPNNAILMEQDNDRVNLGTNAVINGLIDCGSGIDTLAFQMDVPEETLALFSSEIAKLVPGDPQSIVINGLLYDFEDCEIYLNELVGVRVVRPIPTLSEWGLIAMAGILGFVGFIAIRKKYAAV